MAYYHGLVATVLTVHGIETPLSVDMIYRTKLQQYLPFTVLKPIPYDHICQYSSVATVLTVHGIETSHAVST